MGSIWLTDLADVCRATGLTVGEVDGWRIRSRSSGGFDAVLGASAHHTASNPATDGAPDVRYITNVSPYKPISNLYLDRGGQVWVIAAGATNTCGKGGPWLDIGQDQANRTTIGVEMANNGVGEPWPAVQQHAAVTLYRAIWSHYGARFAWSDPRRIFAHKEWAPGRKIDPAGPSMWANSAGIWDMDAFRADVTSGPPISPPPPEDDDMAVPVYLWQHAGYGVIWIVVGADTRRATPAEYDELKATLIVEAGPPADITLDSICHRNGLDRTTLPRV